LLSVKSNKYQIENNEKVLSLSSPQNKSPQLQYHSNFSKILFAGKWYHLGIIQAIVIKQFYHASLTDLLNI